MPVPPLLDQAVAKMTEVSYFSVATATLASALLWFVASDLKERSKRQGHSKIPGPMRLPLLGNALSMPPSHGWLTIAEWKKTYGDMIQLEIFGHTLIAVNSAKIARDLMDKRSALYSDRPHFPFAGELCEFNKSITLMKYDEPWKRQRKIISREFSTSSSIPRYWPLQEQQARLLIKTLLQTPGNIRDQISLRLGIIIQRISYGYPVKSPDDPFLQLALQSLANFTQAGKLGNFMVDFFPFLKHVPEWMPGSGFKKTAREMKECLARATQLPYEWTKKHMITGEALMPNLCGTTLAEAGGSLSPEDENTLIWSAISSVGAGLDTSAASALAFFLAMTMHPDIQKKAQQEIDSVIGTDRLPQISDRPKLPYIRSIMAEVLRWSPAVPLGIAHSVTRDDFYEGYHIPKDAIIVPNVWYMTHDPEVYEEPDKFNPDRFGMQDAEMKKVYDVVFGFGRRSCPGMQFAEGTLFSIITTALAVCDIVPELDAYGKPIYPDLVWSDGVISFPPEFAYKLRPRSGKALSLLAEATSGAE